MIKFEELGLKPEILRAVEDLGFEIPMPVQEKVIPLLLSENKDVVALAQTGTGKTAAFGFPIIQRIDPDEKNVQALILCPTRELCLQITDDLNNYSKYLPDVHVLPVYGGSSIETQIKGLKKGVQIVAATPGRMLDLINRKAANLAAVKTVVLDEADEMLNMGFIESLNEILKVVPENRQTLLFSATMPMEVASIARNYMRTPAEIIIGERNSSSDNVRHLCYTVSNKEKYLTLKRIVDFNPDVYGIVFCRTRRETQEIADALIKDGYNADALHGDLSQSQRDYVMQKFRLRNIRLLVATDVAARGLDVTDLTHIINYNLPDDPETYNHRSGRTGRAGKTGVSAVIVTPGDKRSIKTIEKSINKRFEYADVPQGREICERQLFSQIERMERVEVDNDQIDSYLPVIFKKLDRLDKEDLIRRFVSLEFNRFLNYYREAEDIKTASGDESRKHGKRGKSSDERVKDEDKKNKKPEKGFVRLHLNIGKKDGVYPYVLIDLINQTEKGDKIKIGRIDLTKKDTYFEVKPDDAKTLFKELKSIYYRGKKVSLKTV